MRLLVKSVLILGLLSGEQAFGAYCSNNDQWGSVSGTSTFLWPRNNQVIQRRSDTNAALVHVAGCFSNTAINCVEVISPNLPGTYFAIHNVSGGCYDDYVPLGAGGMYNMQVRGLANNLVVTPTSEIHRVGVGEVFLTAGQSNSTNHGSPDGIYTPPSSDTIIQSCGGVTWSPAISPLAGVCTDGSLGASPFVRLAEQLRNQLGVPIAIVPVGYGGTAMQDWRPDSQNLLVGHPANPTQAILYPGVAWTGLDTSRTVRTNLYTRLRDTAINLKTWSNGFRALLWHQGESNSNAAQPGDNYTAYQINFQYLVRSLHEDPAIRSPFYVLNATATYTGPAFDQNLQTAQNNLREGAVAWWGDNVYAGPNTDYITSTVQGAFNLRCGWIEANDGASPPRSFGSNYHPERCVHFNKPGTELHASKWADALNAVIPWTVPIGLKPLNQYLGNNRDYLTYDGPSPAANYPFVQVEGCVQAVSGGYMTNAMHKMYNYGVQDWALATGDGDITNLAQYGWTDWTVQVDNSIIPGYITPRNVRGPGMSPLWLMWNPTNQDMIATARNNKMFMPGYSNWGASFEGWLYPASLCDGFTK